MGEIKALTSLRGIVAFWVFSYHIQTLMFSNMKPNIGFMSRGYLGVDFFFLLSGLILSLVYGDMPGHIFDIVKYSKFLIARIGRMFPLNAAVTITCAFVAWLNGNPYSPLQVSSEMLLIHRWGFIHAQFNAIDGPAWSISTEWAANLVFPVFVLLALRSARSVSIGLAVLCVLAILWLGHIGNGSLDLSLANTFSPIIRCFSEFALGMLIYRMKPRLSHPDMVVLGSAGGLLTMIVLGLPDPLAVGLFALIIASLGTDSGYISKVFRARPLHRLGELSFSIYLLHLPILQAAMSTGWNSYVIVTAAVAATLGCSELSYRYIEMPARTTAKQISAYVFAAPVTI